MCCGRRVGHAKAGRKHGHCRADCLAYPMVHKTYFLNFQLVSRLGSGSAGWGLPTSRSRGLILLSRVLLNLSWRHRAAAAAGTGLIVVPATGKGQRGDSEKEAYGYLNSSCCLCLHVNSKKRENRRLRRTCCKRPDLINLQCGVEGRRNRVVGASSCSC